MRGCALDVAPQNQKKLTAEVRGRAYQHLWESSISLKAKGEITRYLLEVNGNIILNPDIPDRNDDGRIDIEVDDNRNDIPDVFEIADHVHYTK